jgi:twitching motility two-component system response regulator PilG
MIVDDSPTVRKIMEFTLQQEGYTGMSFPNGIEAFRWLHEHQDCIPQLIFVDVELPKMSGYTLTRHLREKPRFQQIAILLMSSRIGTIERLKARLAGATEYLAKPFTTQMLLTTVQTYLQPPART